MKGRRDRKSRRKESMKRDGDKRESGRGERKVGKKIEENSK